MKKHYLIIAIALVITLVGTATMAFAKARKRGGTMENVTQASILPSQSI